MQGTARTHAGGGGGAARLRPAGRRPAVHMRCCAWMCQWDVSVAWSRRQVPWRLGLCRPFCPAACPVPDGGMARRSDVTCVIGCESIAAGFVWSSGNTRSRESFLSALCGWLFASPLQHAVKHTASLKARAGKGLRRAINVAWHQG
jgi:hypothetical protein